MLSRSGPDGCARIERGTDSSAEFSWDRLSHLDARQLCQLAAKRISDFNAGCEGRDSGPLRFKNLMAPLVEEHSDRDDLSRRMRPVPWYAYGEESTAHFRGFL